MITSANSLVKNTSYKVVIPFYLYAALAFLSATILLFFSTPAFTEHYFHPHTLAITHTMALGWGTMIILGASHQLVPVLIEHHLFSNFLAYLSFFLAAIGIPLLVYGFYTFNMGWPAQWGGVLVNAAILSYLVNLGVSISKSRHENVHAVFVFTAVVWLFLTTLIGLLLVFNFTGNILPMDSLHYLSLHAHTGIIGWFLLLVMGIGSRLIPMFLISKYSNERLLWIIYILVNGALGMFILIFFLTSASALFLLPVAAILAAIGLFAVYCYRSYQQRIRKQVDDQVKLSLLSILMMVVPFIFLLILIIFLTFAGPHSSLVLVYGFSVFFGWITAIIFGMTFKTLPFIVWNRVYHQKAGLGKTPNPKDLFNPKVFKGMGIAYLAGFVLFTAGALCGSIMVLNVAAFLLLLTALLYNWNVFELLMHKAGIV